MAIVVTCASWSAMASGKSHAKQLFDAGLELLCMDDFASDKGTDHARVSLPATGFNVNF
jgi:hypothetical protein